MKTKFFYSASLLLFTLFLGVDVARAQASADTSDVWRVETSDGNVYVGKIVARGEGVLRLQTDTIGTIAIPEASIVRMERLDAPRRPDGQVWTDNPQATRYFWGPNGYGLRRGEGYYQNVWILFNQVSVGLTDHATIGLGLVPLFLWGGEDFPIWVTPKLSIPVVPDKFNLGVGAIAGTILGMSGGDNGAAGIVYGIGTVGARDLNVSFGLGYGFADDEWGRHPALTLSAMSRQGRRSYLLFESYVVSIGEETVGILMAGGRYIPSRISIDYGGIIPFGSGVERLVVLPWLSLVVPIGR